MSKMNINSKNVKYLGDKKMKKGKWWNQRPFLQTNFSAWGKVCVVNVSKDYSKQQKQRIYWSIELLIL